MSPALVAGRPWQEVLGHRVLLGDAPTGTAGTPGAWNSSLWDAGLWGEGWSPIFRDITRALLAAHTTSGAEGLDLSPGVGTVELTLYDLDGMFSPEGSTDWLLGLHVRGYVTPIGRPEKEAFYGVIDKAVAGGTFAHPTVDVTVYDPRSLVGAATTTTPIANQAETAQTRLTNILTAAGFPASQLVIETDLTPLLADDALELGDLFSRTVESAAGLAWADGAGRIHTRNRDWVHGTGAPTYAAYIYAGDPQLIGDPVFPVAQTTDLSASQAISTVANQVTYANRDDPPVVVVVTDLESVNRYGARAKKVDDLACDLALLEDLAVWDLALHRDPLMVCEGATVTVYDADTAAIAGLSLADPVVVGRNDPEGARWELPGIVAGLELDITPDTFQIVVTVTNAAGLGGTDGLWDSGLWAFNRWAAA